MATKKLPDPLAGYKTLLSALALLILGAGFLLDKVSLDVFMGLLSVLLGAGLWGLGAKIERRR